MINEMSKNPRFDGLFMKGEKVNEYELSEIVSEKRLIDVAMMQQYHTWREVGRVYRAYTVRERPTRLD